MPQRNEIRSPRVKEPTDGSPWLDNLGRVWVRFEKHWMTPGVTVHPPTWPELLVQVTSLRRLVPAEPEPSPDLSTDGDGLDLVTHLREEIRGLRESYEVLRASLTEILALPTGTSDSGIVDAVERNLD